MDPKVDKRRRIVVVVLILLAGVAIVVGVLAWPNNETSPTVQPTPEVVDEVTRAPLTGLTVGDEAALDHPAVAVKVSDVRSAHPQVGVNRADIVFVEPIGPSYTRLAAVFHSDLPPLVGPVRSIRPMDAPLLGPMSPVFANTMGAQWVVDYVDSVADVDDLGSLRVTGSGAYIVDDRRPSPDDVFVKPQTLLEQSSFTQAPEPYFDYAADGASSSAALAGGPGQSAAVPYGADWEVRWVYDAPSGRYLREQPWGPHVTDDGTQISAVNVLICEVVSRTGKIGEASGAPVPILELIDSSGPFIALSGGRSVTGTWTKAGVNEPFVLRLDSGDDLQLAPGNTWVELPAPSAGVTVR